MTSCKCSKNPSSRSTLVFPKWLAILVVEAAVAATVAGEAVAVTAEVVVSHLIRTMSREAIS